ncbi:MAG: hypothetical protein ILA11_08820 [Butyrivibrio sp.]|nr:hypothetical protein [Butyrivibrio sp.]
MNNKRNNWIVPVVVIAAVAMVITSWIVTFRIIKHKAEEAALTAAEDLYLGLTGEEFDLDEYTNQEESADDEKEIEAVDISAIYGGWESESYYEFREDGTYGWYKSSEDMSDNYYSGSISVLKGYEACEHLGITMDKVLTVVANSEGTVGLDDIYCITCSPTYLVSNGIDKSDTLGRNSYDLLFVVTGEKSAQATNMGNYDTYFFTKIK